MMIWMRLVESAIKNTGMGPPGAEDRGETDMPADVISYFFMVWVSVILGGVLMIEQYFGRRIFCFNPEEFNEPPPAIAEYCWRHGDFAKNNTETGSIQFMMTEQAGWILQSYVYYFLRALVFFLPHILWKKYRPWISAMIGGSEDIIKELRKLWLQYADVADKAYADFEDMHIDNIGNSNLLFAADKPTAAATTSTNINNNATVSAQRKADVTYNAVIAMTRDVVQITQQQVPRYSRVLTFVTLRMLYTIVVISLYVAVDLFFFATVNSYDSTDYYCPLPNDETIRCMVPMMQFLWHGALLALCCSVFVWFVTVRNMFSMLRILCSSSTAGCFLERVPLSGTTVDLSWQSSRDLRTYKILSKFLLQNVCILHPLNFLEAFVQHLLINKQVPQVQQVLGMDVTAGKNIEKKKGNYDPKEVEAMIKETEGL